MVARIKSDMDKIDKQLTEAESTTMDHSTPPALKSIVPFIFVSCLVSLSLFQELCHVFLF